MGNMANRRKPRFEHGRVGLLVPVATTTLIYSTRETTHWIRYWVETDGDLLVVVDCTFCSHPSGLYTAPHPHPKSHLHSIYCSRTSSSPYLSLVTSASSSNEGTFGCASGAICGAVSESHLSGGPSGRNPAGSVFLKS